MIPLTAMSTEREPALTRRPVLTLLDLVSALGETGATDREVVAAVVDLLESGRVRLLGQGGDEPPAHPLTNDHTTRRQMR